MLLAARLLLVLVGNRPQGNSLDNAISHEHHGQPCRSKRPKVM